MSEKNIIHAFVRDLRHTNCRTLAKRRIPILSWLPHYTIGKCLHDILAGFSVVLTQVPQAIAYGVVAGLEPQYGLYSAFISCFVYAILGSCKDITIGPTALTALMIHPHVLKFGPDGAILLSFLSGGIIILLGVLNLGFIVQLFSFPITAGFTSAAAIQIASTQMNNLLGIRKRTNEFLDAWITVFENIRDVTLWDTLLGCICIFALLSMKQLSRWGSLKYNPEWSPARNHFGRFLWLTSLARNALVVVVCTIMAFVFYNNGKEPFVLTGNITQGLPDFKLPAFDITYNNASYTFGEVMSSFGSSIAFIPLICILDVIAIAKSFAKGKIIDATQEMLALGVSNFLGSFVGSIPVTGSFTRTAVNNASGVQTPLGGTVTGALVLLALAFLTSSFYFIPKTVLAAVIICAMINLFEYDAIPLLWRTKKLDLIPFFATLFSCLFVGLEYGIIIGIGTNLLFIIYASMRPPIRIDVEKIQSGLVIVTPSRSLQFPSAEYVRELIIRKCHYEKTTVVINGKHIGSLDATVAKNLKTLAAELIVRDQYVIFWNFKPSVKAVCEGVDRSMQQYFRDGNLDDILESPAVSEHNLSLMNSTH